MEIRRVATLIALCASLISTSASASACGSGEICSTTTVVAEGSAVVPLALSEPATLAITDGAGNPDIGPGGAIDIAGGTGAATGFALYEDRPARDGQGLVFRTVPEETAFIGEPFTWAGFGSALGPSPRTFSMPAGNYRLAVFTSPGQQVSITIRLDAPEGVSSNVAVLPARFEALSLRSRVIETSASPVHSVGASRNLAATGLVLGTFSMRSNAHVASQGSYCFGEDDVFGVGAPSVHAPDEIAFAPGCPGEIGVVAVAPVIAPSPLGLYYRLDVSAGPAKPGRYGIGHWWAGATVIDTRIPSVAAWLSLD